MKRVEAMKQRVAGEYIQILIILLLSVTGLMTVYTVIGDAIQARLDSVQHALLINNR